MLEFIVLGIIPGTQIQLSPTGVGFLWLTIVLTFKLIIELHRSLKLLENYEQSGLYFMLITKKHRITRRLRSDI